MEVVARFEVAYYQYLNEHSETAGSLPSFTQDTTIMQHLYKTMVLLRAYDKKAITLQRTGKMGTYPSTLGQEAISVAVGHAMKPEDILAPSYRDYGAQLQRGVKMSEIYQYWGGDERGSNFANNAKDFPIAVPIATQCLHAAGAARAFQLRKEPKVAVSCSGDGSTSEGDFYEALNISGAWNLPVVFVVNNNQWAISVPRSKQTHSQTLAQKAIAAGFMGEQVDGNDIIAVRERVGLAIERARLGQGPTLIEAISYRLCDHTTADDASRYCAKADLEKAWEYEPIKRLYQHLCKHKQWSETEEEKWLKQCDELVEIAVRDYLAVPPAPITAMFDYHYEKWPESLINQRNTAIENE